MLVELNLFLFVEKEDYFENGGNIFIYIISIVRNNFLDLFLCLLNFSKIPKFHEL